MFWKRKKKRIEVENYGKTVSELKQRKKDLLSCLIADSYSLKQAIQGFNGGSCNDVTFRHMDTFAINQWHTINDKVKTQPIYKDESKLVFETVIEKGGNIASHLHSDCIERIDVHKGLMLDATTGEKIKEGEPIEYDINVPHFVVALEDLFLIVTFTKV